MKKNIPSEMRDIIRSEYARAVSAFELGTASYDGEKIQAALRCFKHLCETCHTLGLPHPANI